MVIIILIDIFIVLIIVIIITRVSEVVIQELNEDGVSFVEGSSPTVKNIIISIILNLL